MNLTDLAVECHIVCKDGTKEEIIEMAKKDGIKINDPITYTEFKNGEYFRKDVKLLVFDDHIAFLKFLTPAKICVDGKIYG